MWPFNGDEFKYIHTRLNDFGRQLVALSRWDYNFVYSKCAKVDVCVQSFTMLREQQDLLEIRIKQIEHWILEQSKPIAKAKPKPNPKPKAKTKRTRKQGK